MTPGTNPLFKPSPANISDQKKPRYPFDKKNLPFPTMRNGTIKEWFDLSFSTSFFFELLFLAKAGIL